MHHALTRQRSVPKRRFHTHAGPASALAFMAFELLAGAAAAQTLPLPPRPANAPTGTQVTNILTPLSLSEREQWIYAEVVRGNVPDWLRALKPVSVSAAGHTAVYHVLPDYIAIGSDADYFLTPMTPVLAQRLADRLGCTLPTRKMVNQIWTNAPVKLNPQPIPPSPEMTTVPVFAQHNAMVRAQRDTLTNTHPLGALVSGDKKDVIISTLIYSNLHSGVPKPVVIYGWHYTNGQPIQPAYNGHGETYADYSHGIRLVQMACTVDGDPNTVTNVLVQPTLAALFSDETLAPNNTIPLPRYTVSPLAPAILIPPRSRTVTAGSALTLDALAIGDAPLAWQWQRFGTNLPGRTNSSLTLTNVQLADAGLYAVIASNAVGSATSRVAVVRVRTDTPALLFADDFDTDTSARWSVAWGAANGVPDYTVDWAFDYGATPYTFNGVTALIPPAPNSPDGSTRAVRLTVNNSDTNGAPAAVNLYPKDLVLSGDFALKFDLWINYPGGAGGLGSTGSTEHAIFGILHTGTNANWATASAPASDGVWFAVSGEGGDTRDYRAYEGNPTGPPTDLTATLPASNHTAAIYQNLFPATRFETPGAPGKNWVEVELRYTNGVVVWLFDGVVVAQRTNTSAFTNGTVMIGLMDTFASIANPARDAFVLFDNLRVERLGPAAFGFESIAPQPGGVSLVLTGAAGGTYAVEATTNLNPALWQTLATVQGGDGRASFVDTNVTGVPRRFYRARQ